MDRVEKVTGTEPALSRVQDRLQAAFERRKSPFDDGREVKFNFDADAGKVQIRRIHGLGRKPRGFLVIDLKTENVLEPVVIFRTEATKHEIELQIANTTGTGKYAYLIWVY